VRLRSPWREERGLIRVSLSRSNQQVSQGLVSTPTSNDGGLTWIARYIPEDNVFASNVAIAINTAGARDAAGNSGFEVLSRSVNVYTWSSYSQQPSASKPILPVTPLSPMPLPVAMPPVESGSDISGPEPQKPANHAGSFVSAQLVRPSQFDSLTGMNLAMRQMQDDSWVGFVLDSRLDRSVVLPPPEPA